jgi:hypothetical protein
MKHNLHYMCQIALQVYLAPNVLNMPQANSTQEIVRHRYRVCALFYQFIIISLIIGVLLLTYIFYFRQEL